MYTASTSNSVLKDEKMYSYTDDVHEQLVDLVRSCLTYVVDSPEDFRLDVVRSPSIVILTVVCTPEMMGRVLGREGVYAHSMRSLCKAWWGRYSIRVEYSVKAQE